MPTGYTAKLMEQGQEFPEFVLQCARAFGALILMRDEPMDAAIPEKFEPSDYYSKNIAAKSAELTRLRTMKRPAQLAWGEAEKARQIKSTRESLAKARAENHRLVRMEAKVRAWQPPTTDHAGLQKFMLEQIHISKNNTSWQEDRLRELEATSQLTLFRNHVAEVARSIAYSAEEQQKEAARADERTDWVRQLRESLLTE